MHGLAHDIGMFVLSLPVLAVFVWLLVKSPLLASLGKALLLLIWGAMCIPAPLFVAFAVHFPKGSTFAGIFCLAAALFFGVIWFKIGWPELIRTFRSSRDLRPWV